MFSTEKTKCFGVNIRWRSLDGACNKLGDNWLGASFTPFERLLPAEFDDSKSN